MIRILHVIHSMDSRSGGPSHAIREMVRAQAAAGLQPAVLTTNTQSAEPWAEDSEYRRQISSESLFEHIPLHIVRAFGRRRPWSRYSWSAELSAHLKGRFAGNERPDVIHIHGVFSHISQAASAAAAQAGIPYIVRPAGALDTGCLTRGHSLLKRAFISLFLKKTLSYSAFVHVTSEQEAEPIRRQFPGVRVENLPHGVSLDSGTGGRFRRQFTTLNDHPFVLCLCRLHSIKRLDLGIRAFARLSLQYPDLQLVIAGNDAGAQADLEHLVDELQLSDRVIFTGFVSGADKTQAYEEAQVLLHPSEHENYGLSVVEALAAGCPVVTTQGVAAGRYVNESGGGAVVASDEEAIADGLQHVLQRGREQLGGPAADFVAQHLSWRSVTAQQSRLYEEIIRG